MVVEVGPMVVVAQVVLLPRLRASILVAERLTLAPRPTRLRHSQRQRRTTSRSALAAMPVSMEATPRSGHSQPLLEVVEAALPVVEPPAPVGQVVAEVILELAGPVRLIKAGGVDHLSMLATLVEVVAVQGMLGEMLVLLLVRADLAYKVRLLESPHIMLVVVVVLFRLLERVVRVVEGLETSQEPMAGVVVVGHLVRAAPAS